MSYLSAIIVSATLLQGCGDDEVSPDVGSTEARRTVLVYAIAENTLSTAYDTDAQELTTAAASSKIPDDCNILVYSDATSLPRITLFNKYGTTTWKTWSSDQNSADSTVMLSVLREMVQNYPSKSYSLVLWSHGSGWAPTERSIQRIYDNLTARSQARAFGVDNGVNSSLTNGDYDMDISSVKWVLEKLGVHMDYILWDACMMQGVETAYELRNLTDWIIGSPTETPGTGAPYYNAAAALCNADISGIISDYAAYYDNSTKYRSSFPFSCIKTSELKALAEATAPLIRKYFSDMDDMPEALSSAQVYSPRRFIVVRGNNAEVTSPISYDMGSLIAKTATAEEYATWRKALDKAVPYRMVPASEWATGYAAGTYGTAHCTLTDADNYSGISMNVPEDDYDIYWVNREKLEGVPLFWNIYAKSFQWWKAAGWKDTEWELINYIQKDTTL